MFPPTTEKLSKKWFFEIDSEDDDFESSNYEGVGNMTETFDNINECS